MVFNNLEEAYNTIYSTQQAKYQPKTVECLHKTILSLQTTSQESTEIQNHIRLYS